MLIQVAAPLPTSLGQLTYRVPQSLIQGVCVGQRVVVPLGKRRVVGVITAIPTISPIGSDQIKDLLEVIDKDPIITAEQLALCRFVSDYYNASLYDAIRLCLPPDTSKNIPSGWQLTPTGRERIKQGFSPSDPLQILSLLPPRALVKNKDLVKLGIKRAALTPLLEQGYVEQAFANAQKKRRSHISTDAPETATVNQVVLTPDQQTAVNTILTPADLNAFLLEGVTGSGKTEVYLHVAQAMLEAGKSVLFIVPEIALTPQLHDRFVRALGKNVAMLHSGLSDVARREALQTLRNSTCMAAIGARSALFAPLNNLGLIVVDEEHDGSYKQSDSPRYHARDVALWRAHYNKATILLGSATPSLESRLNVQRGKLRHLELNKRVSISGTLPVVDVVDLRARALHSTTQNRDKAKSEGAVHPILSGPLKDAIAATLAQGEQAMIFLNRRGYSVFMLCDACGVICQCPNCSVSLTLHQRANLLRCHQCDHIEPLPNQCTACGFGPLLRLGTGTERVEEELLACFPTASIARLDRDVAKSFRTVQNILQRMQEKRVDILVGTQMIAKGHDFPHVSLVGVVLADVALSVPDFRAAERTFQLLTQVSGRAGRRDKPGRVIVQTYNPEHPAIVFAQHHDTKGFSKQELQIRQAHKQPPFTKATLLRIEGEEQQQAQKAAEQCGQVLHQLCEEQGPQHAFLLGPAPAPLERLRNRFRYHLYLRTTMHQVRQTILQAFLRHEVSTMLAREHLRLIIDVDPLNLL